MVVQRTFIFILLFAAHAHCLSPSRSSQKSEATRAMKDAKAQISRKRLMVVPTPFLPPTKTVSMKKIGARLKSSKPKTFAFSRNSFRFNSPLTSRSKLQVQTKQSRKTNTSRKVVSNLSINQNQFVKSNTRKITQSSKAKTKATGFSKTKNIEKVGSPSTQPAKTEPETMSGVTPEALLVEQRRRKSKMGFSLQRVQSKLDAEESKLELKSLKDKAKSSKPLSGNKNEHVKTKTTKNGTIWANDLTRSDAVQTPVRKEPTPRKTFSAKAFKKLVQRPIDVSSSRVTIKTDGIPAPVPKIQQILSSRQKSTENVVSSKHTGGSLSTDRKLNTEKNTKIAGKSGVQADITKPLPMNIPLPPENADVQIDITKLHSMNIPLPPENAGVQIDITKLHPMNIPLPPENSGMQADITKLHTMNIPLPPENSVVQTDITKLNPMNIPLPPGEMLDKDMFLNMHMQQISLPLDSAMKPQTERSLKVVERPTAPAPTQDNLINSIQSLAKNLETAANTNTIPQPVPKVNTIIRPMVKSKPVQSPVRNQNVILPIPIQRAQSESQTNGIESSVSVSGLNNQPVSAARPFRPGFIPPPPPDSGFVPRQIRTAQGAWNNHFQRLPLRPAQPAKRIIPATLPVRHNQQGVPHHNYIQTKVPLSGVIPQPPGMILRESGRLSHPQNIRPFQQQHVNTAYLTKAPNKQHVQSPQNHFVSGPIRRPNNHHAAAHHFERSNLSHHPPQPTQQNFYDVTPPMYDATTTVTSTTQRPTPGPRRRPPKPRNFDPLKHIMKGKQTRTKTTKKAKTTAKARQPPEPPERTTNADPDRKNFNQKIFKNSFQKDYINEQRGRHPLKNFMLEFERFMKNMDNYFDLSGMIEFKK
nr:uncharacterized protein LOC105335352 [Crassostrea gigas]XP_011437481.2 uncharacterized protein LOC105335352 [Crassostrea gigas]